MSELWKQPSIPMNPETAAESVARESWLHWLILEAGNDLWYMPTTRNLESDFGNSKIVNVVYEPVTVFKNPYGEKGKWEARIISSHNITGNRDISRHSLVVEAIGATAKIFEGDGLFRRPVLSVMGDIVDFADWRAVISNPRVLGPRQQLCGAWMNVVALELGIVPDVHFPMPGKMPRR